MVIYHLQSLKRAYKLIGIAKEVFDFSDYDDHE